MILPAVGQPEMCHLVFLALSIKGYISAVYFGVTESVQHAALQCINKHYSALIHCLHQGLCHRAVEMEWLEEEA